MSPLRQIEHTYTSHRRRPELFADASAGTESEYDILKYGDDYREYMKGVQMWNIARGIIKERGCDIE